MAEIRVEKKSTSIWPWLLGLLFLVIAGFLLFNAFDDDNDVIGEAENTEIEVENPTAIAVEDNREAEVINTGIVTENGVISKSTAAFAAFIESPDAEMNLDHDYTRKALRMMSASLTSMADRYDLDNVQLQNAKKVMASKIDILDNNPMSDKHADHIQEAFMSATKVMEQIQQKHLPGMAKEVRMVCDEAKAFKANELTLHQKDAVKSFFSDAANTLQKMAVALEKEDDLG